MTLPWVVLAAAIQLQPNAPLPPPLEEEAITITADNVELDGAGTFDFRPDRSAFNVNPPEGGGISFTVRLWFGPEGKPVACSIGSTPLREAAETGCAQLKSAATFHLLPGMAASYRQGFIDVSFGFFMNARGGPGGREMFAMPVPVYRNIAINYPPDETPTSNLLAKADGNIIISIDPDDYPPIALRYDLESLSAVLLGIDRAGEIKSCRPISAPGLRTAFLDNYTCDLFIRRGRFEFSPVAPRYEGLHYLTKRLVWKVPR